jgi:hypothetical protein
MTSGIRFDRSNAVYRTGTGIASYAGNLAVTAKRCGFATPALLGTDIEIDPRGPALAAATSDGSSER